MKKTLLFTLLLPIAAFTMNQPENKDPLKGVSYVHIMKRGDTIHTVSEMGNNKLIDDTLGMLEMFIMSGKFYNATCLVNKYPWVAGMLISDPYLHKFSIQYKGLSPYFLTVAWWITLTKNERLKKLRKTPETNGDKNTLLATLLKAISQNKGEISHTFNEKFFFKGKKSYLSGGMKLDGTPISENQKGRLTMVSDGTPIKWYEMFIKEIVPGLVKDHLENPTKSNQS